MSQRQAYHWVAGEMSRLPYPKAQAALEEMLSEPADRLLGPPYGIEALRPGRCPDGSAPQRGAARTDGERQVITMGADRARDFLTRIDTTNVGAETLDQLIDDVRRLVVAYLHEPLPTILGDLADTQACAFTLLEGRQRPEQSRDLYLVAGITCGLMPKASHDMGASHDTMTQTRTGMAATLLDEAGLSARKIADQLGQSQVSVTQDFYLGRKIASEGAARVLEIIGRPDATGSVAAADDRNHE